MTDRIKYSIQKKIYTVVFNGTKYYGEDIDTLIAVLPKEFLQKYELNKKVLQHARGKARHDRVLKRSGVKCGIKGWSKPGYKLKKRTNKKYKTSGIPREAYERALNNIQWCIKMKSRGYNSLPYYLESKRITCDYTGVPYEESIEINNYHNL